jgi:hypothetical protein
VSGSDGKKQLSNLFTAITLAFDLGALAVSTSYGIAEVAAFFGGAEAGPPAALALVNQYYLTGNVVENLFTAISFGSTALNDLVNENTRLSAGSGEIIFGQDTVVSGVGLVLGNFPIFGGFSADGILDTGLNVLTTAYDGARAFSAIPTWFEVRVRAWPPRITADPPAK